MIERFQSDGGRRALVDTIRRNKIVEGDGNLAEVLVEAGDLREISSGGTLIQENGSDDAVYFIVSGNFTVRIKGNTVGLRGPGEVVGEISAVDSTQRRSATVTADEDSIVVAIAGSKFVLIADTFPAIWKALTIDLGRRLVQRNVLVGAVNERPHAFILCSVEALGVTREIQSGLSHDDVIVTLWTNGVFIASQYPLESLEDALAQSDFAIAVTHADDQTLVRGELKRTPRDNVIFELGFFMGKLGRRRTLLVEPRGEQITLPTDLSGITTIGYKVGVPDKLPALLGPACNEIRKIISSLGPRR